MGISEEADVSCPVCTAGQIVQISVELGGERMVLHSCSRCDSRWWDDASGKRMSLESVLTLAGRSGRRRRRAPRPHQGG